MKQEIPLFVEKLWGREEIIKNHDLYCGKILHFQGPTKLEDEIHPINGAHIPGQLVTFRSSIHYHKLKTETFYCVDGFVVLNFHTGHQSESMLEIPTRQIFMHPGDGVTIDPMEIHSFFATKPSRIIEFSTQDFREDSIKLQLSKMIILENLQDFK